MVLIISMKAAAFSEEKNTYKDKNRMQKAKNLHSVIFFDVYYPCLTLVQPLIEGSAVFF